MNTKPKKFILDHRYEASLPEMASESINLQPMVRAQLELDFNFDQHPEFYRGMLSAFLSMLSVMKNPENSKERAQVEISACAAFLAEKITKERGIKPA